LHKRLSETQASHDIHEREIKWSMVWQRFLLQGEEAPQELELANSQAHCHGLGIGATVRPPPADGVLVPSYTSMVPSSRRDAAAARNSRALVSPWMRARCESGLPGLRLNALRKLMESREKSPGLACASLESVLSVRRLRPDPWNTGLEAGWERRGAFTTGEPLAPAFK